MRDVIVLQIWEHPAMRQHWALALTAVQQTRITGTFNAVTNEYIEVTLNHSTE
jgi:hypothetical protein